MWKDGGYVTPVTPEDKALTGLLIFLSIGPLGSSHSESMARPWLKP